MDFVPSHFSFSPVFLSCTIGSDFYCVKAKLVLDKIEQSKKTFEGVKNVPFPNIPNRYIDYFELKNTEETSERA